MGGEMPWPVSTAEARILNLGGSLNVNYSRAITLADNGNSAVNSSGLQANLNLSGDAYRVGSYNGEVSLLNQTVNVETTDQKNRFSVTSYRLALNLFPQWSPLGLTGQRTVRKTDLELATLRVTTKDRIDSLGANWVMSISHLPRLVLSYQETATHPGGRSTSHAYSAFTDTSVGVTRIAVGYQLSTTEAPPGGTSRSHGVNIDTSSQLTTSLIVTAYGRYSSSHLPENVQTPGVTLFQERSAGMGIFYRPPLYWWDGSASYNYSENPFVNDFKSHAVQGSANLRYNEKTDSGFGARYLLVSSTDSTVNSESADASLNYRPFFGLTTGLSGSGGMTSMRATGTANTDNLFQHYQSSISYTKPWQRFQYRAAYNINYGESDTRPGGFSSRDLGNSVNFGVDNTNAEKIHAGLGATFSDIQRVTESVKSEQSSYLIQLSADSSYFRNLILIGDSVGLRGGGSYSHTSGFGVEGRVMSGELTASYGTLIGFSATANYHIDNYPTELHLDRQVLTTQVQYATYLFSRINTLISARDSVEDNRYQADVNVVEGNLNLGYQLGAVTLGAQYQEVETRTAGKRFGSRSVMGRASRAF